MINYRKFELNNGLELYLSNVPHRNDIGIYVMCRVGSNYERKRLNGMSHFLEQSDQRWRDTISIQNLHCRRPGLCRPCDQMIFD